MKGEPLVSIDGWHLIHEKNISDELKSLIESTSMLSFMWHECEALTFEYRDEEVAEGCDESEIRYLDAEDSLMGKCWYCQAKAPPHLRTVWTIHNMDIIPNLPDPIEESWTPKYLKTRLADIERNKKKAIKEGWYEKKE